MEGETELGHVLMYPFPIQGCLNPALTLAELLTSAGLRVTFLNTEHNHRRLSRHAGARAAARRNPRLRFRSIPDGLPEDQPRPVTLFWDLEASLSTTAVSSYRELLADLSVRDSDGWPPLTFVIADGLLPFAADVAEEMGVPGVLPHVERMQLLDVLLHPRSDTERRAPVLCVCMELSGEPDLDEPIRGVAGMESLLRRRDLSSMFRNVKDARDRDLLRLHYVTSRAASVRALILNTCEDLKSSALSHIRAHCPNTYAIGPLHALLRTFTNNSDEGDNDDERGTRNDSKVYSGLWQEDRACLAWLDEQPRKSVLYVSFGSLTVVSKEDLAEFLVGIVNSGHRFLMVVRPDLIVEHERVSKNGGDLLVSEELEQAVKLRGCLVGWAPQDEVLAHPAVGGFLTHSGWNSTLESIVAGVPMLCWPYFADQQVNSRFVSEAWKVGLDMKDLRGREVMERLVRELMEGKRAEQLRSSVADMAEKARSSVTKGGTSFSQLQKLIQHIKSVRISLNNVASLA